MGTPTQRRFRVALFTSACLLGSVLVWHALGQMPVSLAPPGATTLPAPTSHSAFGALPVVPIGQPQPYPAREGVAKGGAVNVPPGMAGRALPTPQDRSGVTLAILGDRTSGGGSTLKYLRQAVGELNDLRPDLVLTMGDHVQGYTRSGVEYAHEAAEYHTIVDQLAMPWYPCAGNHDVVAGTRDPKDRRFEQLYQRYFGPLYYSLDYGDVHVVMLYSDEQLQSEPMISDAQLAWLRNDLNRTFELRRQRGGGGHVLVLVHKPMWRYEKSNWKKVHEQLVAFNSRPVVRIETAGGSEMPPKVEAVFAGHLHAYSDEGAKDGIGYYVLGATGAAINQDRLTGQMQQYTVVKLDAQGPHVSAVEPGSVHGSDYVVAADRAVFEKIAKIDEKTLGIVGTLDQPVGKEVGERDQNGDHLKLMLQNPLNVPLDVAIRLASTRNLNTPVLKDTANIYTDNYDSPWELYVPYATRHLEPGQKVSYHMGLFIQAQPGEVAPPQVEFVVSTIDSKGRTVPIVLKRRVALVPAAQVPIVKGPLTTDAWDDAVQAGTYAFVPSAYDTADPNPELGFLADQDHFYVKVRAEDKQPSYYPNFAEPWNLPSDAVAVEFAAKADAPAANVQRIVVLPFAPNGPELLTNNGVGKEQTGLKPLDLKAHRVTAKVTRTDAAWEMVIAIPRKTIFGTGDTAVMNVVVTENDETYHSQFRSWAREDYGPRAWAKVKVGVAAPGPTPASTPAVPTAK